jgi:hypothetical protein
VRGANHAGRGRRFGALFSSVDLEARVGQNHPLQTIRTVVNDALARLAGDFSALCSPSGRPSIPPEKLLRAMLLQAFYSIRSERQLMERLEVDLLFRWFVGIGVDDAAWDHSTFSKNPRSAAGRRHRRQASERGSGAPARQAVAQRGPLLGRRHADRSLGVDEELKPKRGGDEPPADGGGRNREADFHGQRRSNETHASTPDPDARLYPIVFTTAVGLRLLWGRDDCGRAGSFGFFTA